MAAGKVVKHGISTAQPAGASAPAGVSTLHVSRWGRGEFSLLGAGRLQLLFAVVALTASPAWADGELDTTFGTNGVVKITFPNSSQGYLRDAVTVNDVIIAAGYPITIPCSFPDLFIVKLSLTGTVIGSPSTYPQSAIECPMGLAVDPASGDIFLVGTGGVARF